MEHAKTIMAIELLGIFIFSALLIINSTGNFNSITGKAVYGITQETVLADLESMLPKMGILNDVDEVTMCVIINVDALTRYSYEVVKIGDAAVATYTENWQCKGAAEEDFIISYVNYDKFKEHVDSTPSFNDLRRTSDGTNFYIYPSKYIEPGLTIAGQDEFEAKFGKVIRKYFTNAEVKMMLGEKTIAGIRLPSSITSYLFYALAAFIVVVILITVFIFTHQKQPEVEVNLELTAYIKSALSQGYQQEQIKEMLVSGGWEEAKVQQALNSINSGAAQPETMQKTI